jgi:DNA-directed RNA polymerase specialized sigma24 family protein
VSIDQALETPGANEIAILDLDAALHRLARLDDGLARIVELRAFGGLTIDEAAHVLNVSPSTAKREWRTAKAWLTRELGVEGRSDEHH